MGALDYSAAMSRMTIQQLICFCDFVRDRGVSIALFIGLNCLISTPAIAITTSQYGPYADAGASGALEFGPTNAVGGWVAAGGIWFGDYDDVYALG